MLARAHLRRFFWIPILLILLSLVGVWSQQTPAPDLLDADAVLIAQSLNPPVPDTSRAPASDALEIEPIQVNQRRQK